MEISGLVGQIYWIVIRRKDIVFRTKFVIVFLRDVLKILLLEKVEQILQTFVCNAYALVLQF